MSPEQGVAQRHAGMSERAAVDHDAVELGVDQARNLVDQRTFVI
jgi:hypothetical protein